MSFEKRLAASIVQYLGDQLRSDDLTGEDKEGLEVAIQCLETVYRISSSDVHLLPSRSLVDIFKDAIKNEPIGKDTDEPVSEEDRREAEYLKTRGNDLMKVEQYKDALDSYTKAIKLDPKNAVFYCNRAAAYSKLNQHTFAIEDCRRAIEIDPNYSKAYGRMGLAYANLNNHHLARENYKKALELDPNNDSYASNLKVAEDNIAELERTNPFSTILQNPAIAQVAEGILQDPNMQNMVRDMMSNVFGSLAGGGRPGAPPGAPSGAPSGVPSGAPSGIPNLQSNFPPAGDAGSGAPPTGPGGLPTDPLSGFNLDTMMNIGQQLARQFENMNPELYDQIRRNVGGNGANPPNDNNNSNNNP
ncbi:small glutamine-rich tetratricopeptide repeat-containing protein beta [Tetranychus urticae]|uniref:SGTA homodimerisation domain-containing protein n=1 Tax=Tetranychus urticae TaxID=32264 RepID=T1JTS4_TETUR|nr:small glutamine-rich tetratricopeptide repeat-containing protein beta [Tetranychus urticae]